MKLIHLCLSGSLLLLAPSMEAGESLKESLTFYAPFDGGVNAVVGKGDKTLHWAPKMEFPPKTDAKPGLPSSGSVTLEKGAGVSGDCLKFHRKVPDMIFFYGEGNMPYRTKDWSGTVSFWLKLSPDEELEPGYTDPIQITSKGWNNAAFFVEFSKDETPREFRLGVYPDFKVWNPENRNWNAIPFAEKPLAKVIQPPFSRERWTHVAFSFGNFNTGEKDAKSILYLNGKKAAELAAREQTFTWEPEKVLIMLGLSYIGLWDELAIFNRMLSPDEIAKIHESKNLQQLIGK